MARSGRSLDMERFEAALARANLTYSQLADRIGCDPGTISKWKKGQTPDGYLIAKASAVLEVPALTLFGEQPTAHATDLLIEAIAEMTPDQRSELLVFARYLLARKNSGTVG